MMCRYNRVFLLCDSGVCSACQKHNKHFHNVGQGLKSQCLPCLFLAVENVLPERCTTPPCEDEVTCSSTGSTGEGPTTPPLSPDPITTNSFSDCSPSSQESLSSGFSSPTKGYNLVCV